MSLYCVSLCLSWIHSSWNRKLASHLHVKWNWTFTTCAILFVLPQSKWVYFNNSSWVFTLLLWDAYTTKTHVTICTIDRRDVGCQCVCPGVCLSRPHFRVCPCQQQALHALCSSVRGSQMKGKDSKLLRQDKTKQDRTNWNSVEHRYVDML